MVKKFIIGIDLGGTNLKLALLDFKYKLRDKNVLSTKSFVNPVRNTKALRLENKISNGVKKENLIYAIIDAINKLIKDNQLNRLNILGVGLGLPGPIDVQQGIVHFFPNIAGWKEVKLKNILETRLKLPVFLDNDANLMCLAESRLGAARGFKNAVCVTLGTGVGGGLIIDGGLYRGLSFASGELGHIPINERGPACNCGGIACLEAYIGNNRLKNEAKRLFRRDISLEELSELAKRNNRKALGLWLEVGRHLGIALVGIVNLLNPDCIVIGGGVANAGKVLLDKIKEIILNRAMSIQAKHIKVFRAKLGNDAGLIGAAILVKESKTGS